MSFAHPSLAWLLLPAVPVLAAFFLWAWRERRRRILQFVPARLQETLTLGVSPRRAAIRAVLLVASLTLLLLALARPRYGVDTIEVTQRGLDLYVAIDTSRSMLAQDAGPGVSRLQAARLAALDLARLAKTDRVGLIAFAGSAFLQCPLTIDDEAFRQSVEALDVDVIPEGGTQLAPAFQEALNASRGEEQNVRVLVLFTDGEDHDAGAAAAAASAAKQGMRIYTVGVGSPKGEIILIRDAQGATSYLKDQQGNVVKSSLNESLLREVAEKGGGFYLPLQGPRPMADLFTRLEALPRTDLAARVMEQHREAFQWPLGLALLLLALEILLPECSRVRGAPRAARTTHPTLAGTTAALVLGALFLGTCGAFASPGSALRSYRSGDYTTAQQEFERLAEQQPNDARLHFNAGAAAYRAREYQRAAEHFSRTLRSPDLQLQRDAFYNLGNALYAGGEGNSDPNAKQQAWNSAIQNFESALRLDPQHADAQHNLDFVKQRLEQLKQQQQQQPKQQGQKNQDSKDQKDDQQQDSSGQSKQDQKKEDQSAGDSGKEGESKKDPSSGKDSRDNEDQKDSPQSSPEDQREPDGDQQGKNPQNDPEKQGQSPQPGEEPRDGQQKSGAQNGAAGAPGGEAERKDSMSPQQALRLLDVARGEERALPPPTRKARGRVIKDW